MESQRFFSFDWYNALTLQERADALGQGAVDVEATADYEIARDRVARWRRQAPFSDHSYFAQRLALAGLSEPQFTAILAARPDAIRSTLSQRPSWLNTLARAFHDSRRIVDGDDVIPGPRLDYVVHPSQPLILDGRAGLTDGIRSILQRFRFVPIDGPTIVDLLLIKLAERLAAMLGRTLALELHVDRLMDSLRGETPEQRYQSFLQLLQDPARGLRLLREYPVLARQLASGVERWLVFSLEVLERLCADWRAIVETFVPDREPGNLVSWHDAGDDHRGRHVVILTFTSGFQIVYKPRSLALDCHFQALLGWLNRRGQDPPFRTLRILDRHEYGWVEFVAPQSCEDNSEVVRFYQRQGSNLALLYLLHATDVHHENLIAAGEHPVLIDLETLFHQSPDRPKHAAVDLAWTAMADSVLGVGLLPQRFGTSDESDGIDLSGLGTAEGQLSPFTVPQLEDAGTDQMRWIRKRVTFAAENNRPVLNGTSVDVQAYAHAVQMGFAGTYQLLVRHRDELQSATGPLARFAADELRIVLRPTQAYGDLLVESFHPDVLRDALDRDRLFDRLWIGVVQEPQLARVIPAEYRDLANGDIPIFHTRCDSRHLWTSVGERLTDFFGESGLTLVTRRLTQLGPADLERQLWFIRASFASLETPEGNGLADRVLVPRTCGVAGSDQLMKAAVAVGERIRALAVCSSVETTWIGLTLDPQWRWTITPLGPALYDGLPGVVLFLAYLGDMCGDDSYTVLARAGLACLRGQIEQFRPVFRSVGGFSGWGGVIYTLSSLGSLWRDRQLVEYAHEILQLSADRIDGDDRLDIIEGTAGCLASIIALHQVAPSTAALAVARRCGDHLVARSKPMSAGVGWPSPDQPRPLAGFSHGAAGIAWALLNLAHLTEDERYRETARAAIAYERSLYSPEARNWLDVRVEKASEGQASSSGSGCMTAWCHGAPGVGLARLLTLGLLDDPELENEVRIALETTLEHGFGQNHSLCHGDLGNLDLFLQAADVLDEKELRRRAYCQAAAVLEDIQRNGWLCGASADVETPGLMTGLAGIGYEFLRLVDPWRVPSVLCLAAPVAY